MASALRIAPLSPSRRTSRAPAAQAGRHALTKTLAIELAADAIRVNTVALAFVETPAYERLEVAAA